MTHAMRPTTARPTRRPAAARGNTLVLVTAILVLLVIIATAFLVRAQSGRAQAAAQQKSAARADRVEAIGQTMAQEVADALFVKRIDPSSINAQVNANRATGLTGQPLFGEYLARSDYPRLPADPLAIRYGVDYFDSLSNVTLASVAGGDGFLDGYNYAPFSVAPFTNWPARYGPVPGEGNPVGNPGFGDSRWLSATEPMRALTVGQFGGGAVPFPVQSLTVAGTFVAPAPPGAQVGPGNPANNWSNLALINGLPILNPEGYGFSHWPHLSWIATAENGYRLCWDISDIEGTHDGTPTGTPKTWTGLPGTVNGELSLGTPYEQWLPYVPPREPTVTAKDARGYLVLDSNAWSARVRDWFNAGTTGFGGVPPHAQMILGVAGGGAANANRRFDALPNFLQLAAFGDPSDEFKVYTPNDTLPAGYAVGMPKSRNLISRTLADSDGDGWTDSFWFVAPSSSDRSTRQLVAVRVMDNSALLNVNVATRFEKTNTIGQTPSDLALVSRRESVDETTTIAQPFYQRAYNMRDVPVGFFNAPENDPEYRLSFSNRTYIPGVTPAPNQARLIYATGIATGGTPSGGVDMGWSPYRWEGLRTQPAVAGTAANDTYQPSFLRLLGVMQEGAPGQASRPVPLFDPTATYGLPAAGGTGYGGWYLMTRQADRLTYFKAMAEGGQLLDPISGARLTTLTPFGQDDEVELRGANGLNNAPTISRLEMALNDAASFTSDTVDFGQLLRSSRSREETARFLDPTDPRVQDWRARLAWAPGAAFAPRSGAELNLDVRRKITTVNGARNEMLPPRLWSIIDHTNTATAQDVTRTRPAYQRRGVDFDNDGNPDDVNGDGTVNLADDVAPYHPLIMFPGTTPRGDANGDGVVNFVDAQIARQRFLDDNRKIDLRRPNDPPSVNATTGATAPASAGTRAANDRQFQTDVQRIMRRTLIDEGSRQSYFGTPGQSVGDTNKSLAATKLMIASFAANATCYRDGLQKVTNTLYLDQPLHPQESVLVPTDAVIDPSLQTAGFIGIEKQPFFQEAFIAFVYPKTKLTQAQIDAVTGPAGSPNAGCPDASTCQVDAANPGKLPPCAANGAGENFVTYDPADPNTWPAVVFVVQVANPYNTPVKLADFQIRLNTESGNQRFFFGLPGPAGTKSGNIYGPDVELGPCTPEEPRTAIVFSIPETFPNGDPFPRDAWMDYLDIRQAITETDPTNDTKPGQPFPPDQNAIFAPAWGTTALESANKRGGTLYFDATRTTTPVFPGLDISGDMRQWQPRQAAATAGGESFLELRRAIYPSTGGTPTWTVVDRMDNQLDPAGSQQQSFRDQVLRLSTDEHLPPPLQIECRTNRLAISGIRIRQDDFYVTWARGARQWLYDTQNDGTAAVPSGRGVITLDERNPRYALSRLTGCDRVQNSVTEVYVGTSQAERKGVTMPLTDLPDGGASNPTACWFTMDFWDEWGQSVRGKPTFLPTRIYRNASAGGTTSRRYDYPAWRLTNAAAPTGTILNYGEKGCTEEKFVKGNDPDGQWFVAPIRLFQKDADFDQVGEITDVMMWGPVVARDATGRAFATLPEILAQQPDSTNTLFFPKAAVGMDKRSINRLLTSPALYDTTPGAGGRPTMLSGVQVLPPVADPTDPTTPAQQNGIGFNSRQVAGMALLDAFTVDDRGATPFDSNLDGVIDFGERASAENRRLRLARGFEGKSTPGLVNVNTAPIEVMRAMPHMTRLVYDDDGRLDGLKTVADLTLQQATPWDIGAVDPGPSAPGSLRWDWGVPAPRVRVPEAIDLWRSKGNVVPDLSTNANGVPNHLFAGMPSYYMRGLSLPDAGNNREWAADMRSERGIDSLGELALVSKLAEFRDPSNLVAADIGDSWNQDRGWSVRYAGDNPYRTWWSDSSTGAGHGSALQATGPATAGTLAYRMDGIPKAGTGTVLNSYPLSGRTAIEPHRLTVATDDRSTTTVVETDNPSTAAIETEAYRYDLTAGDRLERNSLLRGISNLVTTRSDVFTIWVRVRTIKQDALTGKWNGTDPENIVDDARYMLTIDRSGVDAPGQKPKILSFVKVPN